MMYTATYTYILTRLDHSDLKKIFSLNNDLKCIESENYNDAFSINYYLRILHNSPGRVRTRVSHSG